LLLPFRSLSVSPKEVRTLFRCLFCTLSSPCGFYEAHTWAPELGLVVPYKAFKES
jgi:hypothetical protein